MCLETMEYYKNCIILYQFVSVTRWLWDISKCFHLQKIFQGSFHFEYRETTRRIRVRRFNVGCKLLRGIFSFQMTSLSPHKQSGKSEELILNLLGSWNFNGDFFVFFPLWSGAEGWNMNGGYYELAQTLAPHQRSSILTLKIHRSTSTQYYESTALMGI